MLDNLELVLLTIDETLDHGQIMEIDAHAVVSRVLMKASEASSVSSKEVITGYLLVLFLYSIFAAIFLLNFIYYC